MRRTGRCKMMRVCVWMAVLGWLLASLAVFYSFFQSHPSASSSSSSSSSLSSSSSSLSSSSSSSSSSLSSSSSSSSLSYSSSAVSQLLHPFPITAVRDHSPAVASAPNVIELEGSSSSSKEEGSKRNSFDFRKEYPSEFLAMRKGLYRDQDTGKIVFAVRRLSHHNNDNIFSKEDRTAEGLDVYCPVPQFKSSKVWSRLQSLSEEIPLPPLAASQNNVEGHPKHIILTTSQCKEDIKSLHSDVSSSFNAVDGSFLLIVSTYNRVVEAATMLSRLAKCQDQFKLLVIDDNSSDGTAAFLRRKGYAVVSKTATRGHVHSWNIGYRISKLLGFHYTAFTSPQVHIPSGSVSVLRAVLKKEAVVMPVTTESGANGNAIQSLLRTYNSEFCWNSVYLEKRCDETPSKPPGLHSFQSYISDLENAQAIQDHLYHRFQLIRGKPEPSNASNPCATDPRRRFGTGGAKSVSLRASASQGVLRRSNRGKSEATSACTEKLRVEREQRRQSKWVELSSQVPLVIDSVHSANITFNSAFFAVNMKLVNGVAYDAENMFDPKQVSRASMESGFIQQLVRQRLKPRICAYAFVHHSDSVPVDSERKSMAGSDSASDSTKSYEALAAVVHDLQSSPKIVIGMATSNPVKNPSAGDIYTSRELANSLKEKYHVQIQFLYEDSDWYNLHGIDLLLVFLDYYELDRVYNEHPSLVSVAWMRNWFQRWLSRPFIGNYDLLLTSSSLSNEVITHLQESSPFPQACSHKCPGVFHHFGARGGAVQSSVLRIATNERLFSALPPEECLISVHSLAADYVFTGSYWEARRDIMELDPNATQLQAFTGRIIGKNWEAAVSSGLVSPDWRPLIKGDVPYALLPDVYRQSKVVIDDANHVTKPWGSVNSRVFDALASGALVITNGAIGSLEVFDGALPYFESASSLANSLGEYLRNDDLRRATVTKLRNTVLKLHTYSRRADEFASYMNQVVSKDIYFNSTKDKSEAMLSKDHICIVIRVYEGQSLEHLKLLLQSLELQRSSLLDKSPSLDVCYFIINTDQASEDYSQRLKSIVERYSSRSSRFQLLDKPRIVKSVVSEVSSMFNTLHCSDVALDHLLQRKPSCEWIMVTNGDNAYNTAWMSSIMPLANTPSVQVIAWNFVSHRARNGTANTPVYFSLRGEDLDLGAMLFRRSLLVQSKAKFLSSSVFTKGLISRETGFVQKIIHQLPPLSPSGHHRVGLYIIPSILLIQQ